MNKSSPETKTFSRRDFLKLGSLATAGVLLGTACQEQTKPDIEKATQIRQEIRKFIDETGDNVNEENLKHLFDLNKSLYESVFGRQSLPIRLDIVANDTLTKEGKKVQEIPSGNTNYMDLIKKSDGTVQVKDIVLSLYPGNPNIKDPDMKKMEVMDAVLKHELIHAETLAKIQPMTIQVEGYPQRVTANGVRGLKWVLVTSGTNESSEFGHFFEECNTQLLAEYMDDPSGNSALYSKLFQNNTYHDSVGFEYHTGGEYLQKIYGRLGIKLTDVEQYHYNAQPKELVESVNKLTREKMIQTGTSPSYILLITDPRQNFSTYHLPKLAELAAKY